MDARIFFRKLKENKELSIDTNIHSCAEWGIMPTDWEFNVIPEMKDLPSNDWVDENGVDEYIPDEPKFKAFEMNIGFCYRGNDAINSIGNFFHYLAFGGEFSIYDSHSGIGYHKCRYVKYSPDAYQIKKDEENIVQFTITIKVIDPITKVKLA